MQLCGSLSILWHCLSLGLEWKLTFSSPVVTAEFSKFAGILSGILSTFTAASFRIWISSTEILSPPLALFVVMLLRPTWLHTPGCLALDEWSHHCGYLGHEDLFCIILLYSCHLFLISSASIKSIPFLSFIVRVLYSRSTSFFSFLFFCQVPPAFRSLCHSSCLELSFPFHPI